MRRKQKPAPFPPGPKLLPLIGNLRDFPDTEEWLAFSELGKKYGGMVYFNILGTSILVLNQSKYAYDLLDKKGRIYSDRPIFTMAGQLVGYEDEPGLSRYGEKWSQYRRHFSNFMGAPSKLAGYSDLFQTSVGRWVERIKEEPMNWGEHTRHFAAGIVLQMTYGLEPAQEPELIKLVALAMEQFSEMLAPNAFMVDAFPLLRFVPSWFPGTDWQKKIPMYRQTLLDLVNIPYYKVKEHIKMGTTSPCFVTNRHEVSPEMTSTDEDNLKWAAMGIYSGGADTTLAAIKCLVLAMCLHPDEQQKAQAEIDSTLGVGSTPTLADRKSLPYCEALYWEVFRLYVTQSGPLGLPHASTEDDIHEGYLIPKGTIILPNTWQFCRDPDTYQDPELFNPDRFVDTPSHKAEPDPRGVIFGFGRRVCPGVHLADTAAWLAFVTLVATLEIRPTSDETLEVKFTGGGVRHPAPFNLLVIPRRGH